MHHIDTNKMHGEIARWEIHENAACCLEQILEATPHRIALYDHLPLISQIFQVRKIRHAGHCWRNKGKLISDILLWTPARRYASITQTAKTFICFVWIQDAAKKTCQEWWMIGMDDERESENSVLPAWLDNVSKHITMYYEKVSFQQNRMSSLYKDVSKGIQRRSIIHSNSSIDERAKGFVIVCWFHCRFIPKY